MPITSTQREHAGHDVRVRQAKLAEATVADQYRRQPDLVQRYGPDGRRLCVRDVAHHVQALASSIELGEPERFVDYVIWARGVMAAHKVEPADFLESLRSMQAVAGDVLTPGAAALAVAHIDAAMAAWDQPPRKSCDGM